MSSVAIAGNTSGSVTLNAPDVAGSTTITLPSISGTMLSTGSTVTEAQGGTGTTTGYYGFKNRIINGAMVIDQRNAGASVTPANATVTYTTDRWNFYEDTGGAITAQQSSTAPAGFVNSLLLTVTSNSSATAAQICRLQQRIEGFNVSDLAWGTSSAQPVTISFWVRSSLVGTYSVCAMNVSVTRAYVQTYTINSANTWEYKTVTIAGCTDGTWATNNTTGMYVQFDLGSGSNYNTTAGAWQNAEYYKTSAQANWIGTASSTFYITGVQLEKGSTATSFDYRPYGTELQLCQRYYYKFLNDTGASSSLANLQAYSASAAIGKLIDLPVPMRTTPTCSTSGTFAALNAGGSAFNNFTGTVVDSITRFSLGTGGWTGTSGLVAGNATLVNIANNAYVQASAEL